MHTETLGRLLRASRWIIAFFLLLFIVQSISWTQVKQIGMQLNPLMLISAIALQLLSSCIAAIRWAKMMQFFSFTNGTTWYIRVYLVAILFNQALPTSIGGDALRVYEVAKCGNTKRSSFASVITDRIFGVSGLLCLSLFANNSLDHSFPSTFVQLVNIVCILGICTIIFVAVIGVLPFVKNFPLQRIKAFEPCWIISSYTRRILLTPLQCCVQLVLAISTHIMTIAAFACIGIGIGLSLPITTYAVFVPPLLLFSLIPLSFGGWGVRETGTVALLGLINTDATTAIAASVLYGIVLIATSIPGFVLYVQQPNKTKVTHT